ncbi:helix-turn-helix transcriptional regulator [Streptomyces sp. NBC_01795]|uniref:helix-turn-helix transcriptional regulator n=1 Tax=Streptomyces sp. NBC_01795 TaxID=2975943 RepID=UPI003FA3ADB8
MALPFHVAARNGDPILPADPRHDVGQNIAAVRRLRNRTQQELADTSGVSYHMVRSVERGARAPSEHVLDALAAALAVDPSRLLGHRARSDSRGPSPAGAGHRSRVGAAS